MKRDRVLYLHARRWGSAVAGGGGRGAGVALPAPPAAQASSAWRRSRRGDSDESRRGAAPLAG